MHTPTARALILALALAGVIVAPVAHAALTISAMNTPDRVSVATTWNTVTYPAGTDYLMIFPETVTGYWMVGCTDGAALGSEYGTLPADSITVIAVHQIDRNGKFCIAASGSGTAQITPMPRGK